MKEDTISTIAVNAIVAILIIVIEAVIIIEHNINFIITIINSCLVIIVNIADWRECMNHTKQYFIIID